jgi:hypothetical protein
VVLQSELAKSSPNTSMAFPVDLRACGTLAPDYWGNACILEFVTYPTVTLALDVVCLGNEAES